MAGPEPFNPAAQLRLGERRLGVIIKEFGRAYSVERKREKRGTESKKRASCCFYFIHHSVERTC